MHTDMINKAGIVQDNYGYMQVFSPTQYTYNETLLNPGL